MTFESTGVLVAVDGSKKFCPIGATQCLSNKMPTVEIPLTQGLFARVSSCDAEIVGQFKWHAVKARRTHYAATNKNGKCIYMHRLVTGTLLLGRKVFVDHIDFDGLNNARENLRACSPAESGLHRRAKKDYTNCRGVTRSKDRFVAQIGHQDRFIYLGTFDTEREAAIAYYAAQTALFGEFAPRMPS